MATRKLIATEGKWFTNGNAYGHVIELGIYDSPDNWYEITDEEYAKIKEKEASINEQP